MARALAQGHPVQMPAITSIARTLGAPAVSPRTLAMAQRYLESVTVVEDAEAVAACVLLLERAKVLTEPAASCTLALADRLRDRFSPESHVVLVLCGGNVSLEDLCRFRAQLAIELQHFGQRNGAVERVWTRLSDRNIRGDYQPGSDNREPGQPPGRLE